MSSPPHPVMHFGMTGTRLSSTPFGVTCLHLPSGWMAIKGSHTYYYKAKPEDNPEWPPKYWKFNLSTADDEPVEAAFTDSRRFGRIRLVDCDGGEIRNTSPLKENGPDPVVDRDRLTEEWFGELLRRKHVPVKALLLDQANISGVGNWVGDEIMYHARLHPEQYSDTFSDAEISTLHKSLLYVCKTAVDLLADSEKFPEDWLFKHRWGKGKNKDPRMPGGERITFLTVGGRTSAVVPSLQKKTGRVAGDVKSEEAEDEVDGEKRKGQAKGKKAKLEEDDADERPKGRGRAKKVKKEEDNGEDEVEQPEPKSKRANKATPKIEAPELEPEDPKPKANIRAKRAKAVKPPPPEERDEAAAEPVEDAKPPSRKRKAPSAPEEAKKAKVDGVGIAKEDEGGGTTGRRRSARVSSGRS